MAVENFVAKFVEGNWSNRSISTFDQICSSLFVVVLEACLEHVAKVGVGFTVILDHSILQKQNWLIPKTKPVNTKTKTGFYKFQRLLKILWLANEMVINYFCDNILWYIDELQLEEVTSISKTQNHAPPIHRCHARPSLPVVPNPNPAPPNL